MKLTPFIPPSCWAAIKHRVGALVLTSAQSARALAWPLKRLPFVIAVLVAFLATAAFAHDSSSDQILLSDLLLEDGTIDLSHDLSGSIDATGFRMSHALDGAPIFANGEGLWHSLGTGDANGVGGLPYTASVIAMAVFNSELYVGGNFLEAGGQPAYRIARWDGSNWHSLADQPNDWVLSMTVIGSNLYVGGIFTKVGQLAVNRIARWDGSEWHRLGTEDANGVGMSAIAQVMALASDGTDLYVGGSFHEVAGGAQFGSGVEAFNVARWDGAEWHSLGIGEANGLSGQAQAIAVHGPHVFVGGWFEDAGGQLVNNIARWDGSGWHGLGSGVESNEGLSFDVTALAVMGSDLFVGGEFQRAGGLNANGIARWDGSGWHVLGTGAQRSVRSLAVIGSDLFVGRLRNVSRWDGAVWHSLAPEGLLAVNQYALVIEKWGPDLYVGGNFTEAGGHSANGVARWSGLAVSAEPDDSLATVFGLVASFPNPFTATTKIEFSLRQPASVSLEAYDTLGRRVDVLQENVALLAGRHQVSWTPSGLAPGVYMLRMSSAGRSQTVQVLLVR